MLTNRLLTISIIFIMLMFLASAANAEYALEAWTFTTSGGQGNSDTYELFSSFGQPQPIEVPAGNATSENFQIFAGFLSATMGPTTIPPVITDINPASVCQGTDNLDVVITGKNFQDGATVTFSGTGITINSTTVDSDTQITVNISVALEAYSDSLTVTNPDGGSDTDVFTVGTTPTITNITPDYVTQGETLDMIITGTGFQNGLTVSFCDGVTENSKTVDSSTQITVNITVSDTATPGACQVTVTNPSGCEGGGEFTIIEGVTVKLEPATKEIAVGVPATINVMVENAPGVSAFEFKILYDSNVVSIKQPTDVILGPFLGSTGRTVFPIGPDIRENLDPAEVTFGAASLSGPNPLPTGDGVLASIVFTGVDVGTTTLDLTNVKLLDADAEKIPLSEGDGEITVVEQILYGDVSGNGIVSAFDASLILQAVVGLISLPDPHYPQFDILTADVSGNGQITSYDTALVLQHNVGLISCFPADPSCQAAPTSLAGSYSLRIPTLTAKLGEKVIVPLIVNNDATNSPKDIPFSGQFVLEYDVVSLNFLRVFSQQLNKETVTYRRDGKQLHIAFANHQSLNCLSDNDADSGIEILFIEFELRSNIYPQSVFPLTLSQASLNEGVIPTLYSGGIKMLPIKTVAMPNYPNPFNPETWIPYYLSYGCDVQLKIYNQKGELARHIDLGYKQPGVYKTRGEAIHWDGRNGQGEMVASGLYFYELKAGKFTQVRRMLLLK